MNFSSISKQILSVFLFCNIHSVISGGRTISDWRIQSKDVTPILGRGYSVATGDLQSSCLDVQETTTPSYDYDYYFTEFNRNDRKSIKEAFAGKISGSFGFLWAKAHIEAAEEKDVLKKKRFIIATMRTQRYYSSVDEVHSDLSDDARILLENGQYMSFFQACGPNYIRSIRRAAEVSAIFEYESTEQSLSEEFEAGIKMNIQGLLGKSSGINASSSKSTESEAMRSSLKISVRAFGLGLNDDGESSLNPSDMNELQDTMDYAFRSMQQKKVGMVSSIEIVAWVDNPRFQVAAALHDKVQECKNNYCTTVSMELKKMYLSTNAEYVATMNHVFRKNIDNIQNIHLCRSLLNNFSEDQYDDYLLNHRKSDDRVNKTGERNTSLMTVKGLRRILNTEAARATEERAENYSKLFFVPCMSALSEDFGGQQGGNSMVKPWYMIDACKESTCTVSGATINKDGRCSIDSSDRVAINVEQYCMPTISRQV